MPDLTFAEAAMVSGALAQMISLQEGTTPSRSSWVALEAASVK